MSYWTYYLAWTFLAYAMREPWLLAGVAVFLVLRKFIPDPTAIFRAMQRTSALRAQVGVNAANITARRDLAIIYLDLLRPRAALALVEQALVRAPDDPELLYLSGLALHRVGRDQEALAPLVRAVDQDPRLRFGLPYLVVGDALTALGRTEEAVDAYERYTGTNSSDVAGQIRLARAHARLGEHEEAKKAIGEAIHTWHVLRGGMKRRQLFRGYLAAQWGKVSILREPLAIAVAFALAAATAFGAHAAYPSVVKLVNGQRTHRVAPRTVDPTD